MLLEFQRDVTMWFFPPVGARTLMKSARNSSISHQPFTRLNGKMCYRAFFTGRVCQPSVAFISGFPAMSKHVIGCTVLHLKKLKGRGSFTWRTSRWYPRRLLYCSRPVLRAINHLKCFFFLSIVFFSLSGFCFREECVHAWFISTEVCVCT